MDQLNSRSRFTRARWSFERLIKVQSVATTHLDQSWDLIQNNTQAQKQLIYLQAVMRLSTPKKTENLEGRHIASLTNSQTLILNLQELQKMASFCFDVVFINDPQLRIYAYEHNQAENCYILIIPICFYQSTKNKSKAFIQLVCLYSQSITIPTCSSLLEDFQELLRKYCLNYHKKKGSNVVKLYIQGDCWSSYLDFVTSQAIQFKNKNSKELIAMKKHNAFEYCLNAFKEQLLPDIYQNSQDSIQNALQYCVSQIKELYHFLACFQRFGVIYEVMKQVGGTFTDLLTQIELISTAKSITTVGDDECEELINEELSIIVKEELSLQQKELNRMKPLEQQVFLVKILANLLQKLRNYNFDITDQKYLFLSSKIIEQVYSIHYEQAKCNQQHCFQLEKVIQEKDKEIQKLRKELQEAKFYSNSARKQPNLAVIKEEGQEEIPTVKRIQTQNQSAKAKPLVTLKDLKEPLQVINTNISSDKLHKIPLSKAKEKLKEGLRKREEQKSNTLKNILKV